MRRERVILGVDPGGTSSGLVVRQGDYFLDHHVCKRRSGDPVDHYLHEVSELFHVMLAEAEGRVGAVAVEATNAPTGQMGMTSVQGLLDAAWVGGAILGQKHMYSFIPVLVPPGGHGDKVPQAYPEKLWGAREGTAGQGTLRHARAAWDIAGTAATMLRQNPRTIDV